MEDKIKKNIVFYKVEHSQNLIKNNFNFIMRKLIMDFIFRIKTNLLKIYNKIKLYNKLMQ